MEQTTLTLSAADFAACLSIRLSQPDVDDRQNLVDHRCPLRRNGSHIADSQAAHANDGYGATRSESCIAAFSLLEPVNFLAS